MSASIHDVIVAKSRSDFGSRIALVASWEEPPLRALVGQVSLSLLTVDRILRRCSARQPTSYREEAQPFGDHVSQPVARVPALARNLAGTAKSATTMKWRSIPPPPFAHRETESSAGLVGCRLIRSYDPGGCQRMLHDVSTSRRTCGWAEPSHAPDTPRVSCLIPAGDAAGSSVMIQRQDPTALLAFAARG